MNRLNFMACLMWHSVAEGRRSRGTGTSNFSDVTQGSRYFPLIIFDLAHSCLKITVRHTTSTSQDKTQNFTEKFSRLCPVRSPIRGAVVSIVMTPT